MGTMDLWGEFLPEPVRTPAAILREQAALLGPKSEHLLEAEVSTQTDVTGEFIHTFDLVVPSLEGYRYRLFRVTHSVTLYPALGMLPSTRAVRLDDEAALTDWLRDVFTSRETRRVIAALIAQAKS